MDRYVFKEPTYMYVDRDTNTLEDALDVLNQLAKLEPNWNGYGAEPFTERLINVIQRALPELKIMPLLFPTATEAIQFEYENDTTYLEFTVYETYFNYYVSIKDLDYSVASEEHIPLDKLTYTINLMLRLYYIGGEDKPNE